ncbi:MAG: hypothetical protein FD123_2337 [Bacteroidetes bacterium]|nr:MAG: hypothetical protein FD123_2337 [Bacteroidota bacterium]
MKPELVILFIIIVAALAVLGYYFSRKAVVRRGLRKSEEKKIGHFSDGDTGRVVGRVVFAGRTLTAPLSKRSCVYYHVVVEEYRSSGKSGSWHTVIEEEQKGDVVIFDGSHYAVIDTGNAKTYLVPDANYSSGTFNDATHELEQFLQRHNRTSTGLLGFNKSLRYREGVLERDETFAVAGRGRWTATHHHNLKLSAQRVLVISPGETGHVYLSDDPGVTS